MGKICLRLTIFHVHNNILTIKIYFVQCYLYHVDNIDHGNTRDITILTKRRTILYNCDDDEFSTFTSEISKPIQRKLKVH